MTAMTGDSEVRAKIMVVEDERIVATDLQRTLERSGHRVTAVVASGEDAVTSARETAPELALVDIVLSGAMDGIDAAEQLHFGLGVPVIYLTAYDDEELVCRAKATEPLGYLLKPYDERELLTMVETALHRYQASEQRSRQALEDSHRHLTEAQQIGRVGSWEWDVAKNTALWSDEQHRIFGLEPGQFDGSKESFVALFHPDDRRRVERDIDRAARKGASFAHELRVVCLDGTMRVISSRGEAVRDDQGRIARVVGTTLDITEQHVAREEIRRLNDELEGRVVERTAQLQEARAALEQDVARRKQAEEGIRCLNAELEERISTRTMQLRETNEELRREIGERIRASRALSESEATFRAIIEEAPIAIACVDLEGNVLQSNHALHELFGCTEEQYKRKGCVGFTEASDVKTDRALFSELVKGRRDRYDVEKRYIRTDGRIVWGHLTVSLVRDESGQPLFTIGMIQDVTEAKRLENMKSDFIGVVSHELRTPLTVILGFTRLLERPEARRRADVVAKSVDAIRDKAEVMTALVEELLDVTRIESGQLELSERDVDVEKLVDECVSSTPLTERHELSASAEVGLPEVWCDPNRLSRAVSGLLSNAVKFSPEGGKITVRVRQKDEDLCISVSDHGIGIPAEERRHLFDRFTQRDMSTTRSFGGFGMGLYLAKWAIEAHGGRIDVRSKPGKGSTFTIRIPIETRLRKAA